MTQVPKYDGTESDYKGHVFPYDYGRGITGRRAASYRAVVKTMQLTSFTGISYVANEYPGERSFWDRLFNRREVIGEIRVEQAFPLLEIEGKIVHVISEPILRSNKWFVA